MDSDNKLVKIAAIASTVAGVVGLGCGIGLVRDSNSLNITNSNIVSNFAKGDSACVSLEQSLIDRYEGTLPEDLEEYFEEKKINYFKHKATDAEIKQYEQNDARANFEEASGVAMLLGGALCLGATAGLVVAEKRLTDEEKEMSDD